MSILIWSPVNDAPRGAGAWMLDGLRLVVAAFFLFMAWKNLSGDEQMAADFTRWGYSPGFRRFTGVLQIVGALALSVPSICFLGGLLLAGVLAGAIVTHALHDPPAALVSPVVFVLLVAVAVLRYRPPLLR